MEDKKCLSCGKSLKKIRPILEKRKFCSRMCSMNYVRVQRRKTKKYNLSPVKSGAVKELLVSADLFRRGYSVFRSMCSCAICDLVIIDKKNKTKRIEVTTGISNKNGTLGFSKKDKIKYDVLAVVFENDLIKYYPPWPNEEKDEIGPGQD